MCNAIDGDQMHIQPEEVVEELCQVNIYLHSVLHVRAGMHRRLPNIAKSACRGLMVEPNYNSENSDYCN